MVSIYMFVLCITIFPICFCSLYYENIHALLRFMHCCDSCIAGKSQQFLKLRDDKLYTIVNGFNIHICLYSALLFPYFPLFIIKILIKTNIS